MTKFQSIVLTELEYITTLEMVYFVATKMKKLIMNLIASKMLLKNVLNMLGQSLWLPGKLEDMILLTKTLIMNNQELYG